MTCLFAHARAYPFFREIHGLLGLSILLMAGSSNAEAQKSNAQEIQIREATPTFKIRAERNVVVVRVVVRDAKGRTVGGLRKEDFRLSDSGKPQEISSFAVQALAPQRPGEKAGAPGAAQAKEAAETPAAPVTTFPGRFVGLYFDDFHISVEAVGRTRDAAWRYITGAVRPEDRLAIFTSSGLGEIDFTADRGKLHEALLHMAPRSRTSTVRSCPEIGDYQAYLIDQLRDRDAMAIAVAEAIRCDCGITPASLDPYERGMNLGIPGCGEMAYSIVAPEAAMVWSEAALQSRNALRTVEGAVQRLSSMPGQRTLVLVSLGFLTATHEDAMEDVIHRALHRDVVISAIDAAGLYAYEPRQMLNLGRPDLESRKDLLLHVAAEAHGDVLANLAASTGGVYFRNSNDFDEGFRQTAAPPEAYYVLTFSPQDIKLDGKFHRIKVKLEHPEHLSVLARRGYFASLAEVAEKGSAGEGLQKAVFSQEQSSSLPVSVTTRVDKQHTPQPALIVLIHVDLRGLQFRKVAQRSVNTLIFDTVLFDSDGKYVTAKESSLELHLKDETLQKFEQSGINAETVFRVAPGTYRVRQLVRDTESRGMSALNTDVQIPQ